MKGVELPINAIVIVILAVVVLIAILALMTGVVTPSNTGINLESAKNNACQMFVSMGCNDTNKTNVKDFDANKNGILNENGQRSSGATIVDCRQGVNSFDDNLAMLCLCWYNFDEMGCKKLCSCSI